MSGHSKWKDIKHKSGRTDQAREDARVAAYVDRIRAACAYEGSDDREDVPSILSELVARVASLEAERTLVYGELNKALASRAPEAWDRIADALKKGGDVAESNAPIASGEVQESRPAVAALRSGKEDEG